MVKIDPTLNPLEVMVVADHLEKQGVTSYTLLPGNDCIWATHNLIHQYYIFSKGLLVDIQVD
jgi:hypothetical protein